MGNLVRDKIPDIIRAVTRAGLQWLSSVRRAGTTAGLVGITRMLSIGAGS
jgi:hypothetical protein